MANSLTQVTILIFTQFMIHKLSDPNSRFLPRQPPMASYFSPAYNLRLHAVVVSFWRFSTRLVKYSGSTLQQQAHQLISARLS